MPYINRRTGQVLNIPRQQTPSQVPDGSSNPLFGIRSGLGLGSTLSNIGGFRNLGLGLGSLGGILGLGSSIANRNPSGIASSAGSLGFSAGKAGFLGGDVARFLTGAPGASFLAPSQGLANLGGLVGAGTESGLLGTLGPIGALAGVTSLLSGFLTSPAQNKVFTGNPFTGFMGTSGQLLKDIKAEAIILNKHRKEINEFLSQGQPTPLEHLRVTGSFTKDARGRDVSTNEFVPKLLVEYLNRGINVPKIGGNYVFPIQASLGAFQAGQMRLRPSGEPLQTMLVSVPIEDISKKVSKITGQAVYRVPKDTFTAARDRRSEERSRSRDD